MMVGHVLTWGVLRGTATCSHVWAGSQTRLHDSHICLQLYGEAMTKAGTWLLLSSPPLAYFSEEVLIEKSEGNAQQQ